MRGAGLIAGALALSLGGCVDIYRGAIVQLNLKPGTAAAPSAEGQHYELFAEVNGGLVSLAKYKIFENVADCGADPATTPPVQLVQRYDDGADRATLCGGHRTLGAIDRTDLAAASLVGGVRIDTPVDLSAATRLIISLETDGDSDPRPAQVLLGADLAPGRAPYDQVAVDCAAAFCATADPESAVYGQLCGDNAPTLPRLRRGVRVGEFLVEPVPADLCLAATAGQVAVVPADDDTFL